MLHAGADAPRNVSRISILVHGTMLRALSFEASFIVV